MADRGDHLPQHLLDDFKIYRKPEDNLWIMYSYEDEVFEITNPSLFVLPNGDLYPRRLHCRCQRQAQSHSRPGPSSSLPMELCELWGPHSRISTCQQPGREGTPDDNSPPFLFPFRRGIAFSEIHRLRPPSIAVAAEWHFTGGDPLPGSQRRRLPPDP